MYPPDVIRCPVHRMPDCSPLLNGCSIPSSLAQAYDAGRDSAQDDPFVNTVVVETRQELAAILADDTHIANLRKDGYGLRHGFPCRATGLMGCDVDRALASLGKPPDEPEGFYLVSVDDGGALVIGSPVDQSHDPVAERLSAVIERLSRG